MLLSNSWRWDEYSTLGVRKLAVVWRRRLSEKQIPLDPLVRDLRQSERSSWLDDASLQPVRCKVLEAFVTSTLWNASCNDTLHRVALDANRGSPQLRRHVIWWLRFLDDCVSMPGTCTAMSMFWQGLVAVEHWPLSTATIIDIVVSVSKERHCNSRRFLCGQKMQTKTMNGSDMMWQTAAAQLAVFFLQERRS